VRNLSAAYEHGRLGHSGYLSVFPVDQGIERPAATSFAKIPAYFDPETFVELAIAAASDAVATTLGALGILSRRYAHRIPMVVKLTHLELLTYPPKHDQVTCAPVRQAVDLGEMGVGATVYFGSAEAHRQIQEVGKMFAEAHRHGLSTVLWAYLRNEAPKTPEADYPTAADPTGQANHIGVTLEADIIKQKQPELDGGFTASKFAMTDRRV
jgi:class I fructose-bisphosphate aldolase